MKKKWFYYLAFFGLLLFGLFLNYLLPLGLVAVSDFEQGDKWAKAENAFLEQSVDFALKKSEPYPFKPVLAYNRYYYKRISDKTVSFPEELFLSKTLIKDLKENLLDKTYDVIEVKLDFNTISVYPNHARLALTKQFSLKTKDEANNDRYYRLSLNEAYLIEKVGEEWKLATLINDCHPFYWEYRQRESSEPLLDWTTDRYDNVKERYGNVELGESIEGLLVNPNTCLEPIQNTKQIEFKLNFMP